MKLINAVAAAALATVITTSVAEAQTTLYGCYVKNTGTVYRIKVPGTPTTCSTNHTQFSWNLEGQPGPQGPQGPAGPSGWPGVDLRSVSVTVYPGPYPAGSTVICLPGQVLLSGGYEINNGATEYQVVANAPVYENQGGVMVSGWRLMFRNNQANGGVSATVYAYCRTAIN